MGDFTFSRDSQNVLFLGRGLKREENLPLKQDFEAAAVVALITAFPGGWGIVGGKRRRRRKRRRGGC